MGEVTGSIRYLFLQFLIPSIYYNLQKTSELYP